MLNLIRGFVLSLVIAASPAMAGKMTLLGAGLPGAAAPAGFTGVGDIVAGAAAGYSFRAWSAATRGTKAVNVCNVSDVACADLSTDATTGDLVVTTIGGTDCSVATCTVKTVYDQSGSNGCTGAVPCDASQTTIANRPIFKTSCTNSKPCMQCTASSSQFLINTHFISSTSQSYSITFTAERNGAFTSFGDVITGDNGNSQFGFSNSTNAALAFAGTVASATAADSAFHAVQTLANGASSILYVDGSSNAVSIGAATMDSNIGLCASSTGGGNLGTAFVAEAGFWAGDKSGSFSGINSNQRTYWGF